MLIFNKEFKDKSSLIDLFEKIKNNKMIINDIFNNQDYNLINKCVKELKGNLFEAKDINFEKVQLNKYLHVLKITKERFSNYFHFYTLEELMILNRLIKKIEKDLKQF